MIRRLKTYGVEIGAWPIECRVAGAGEICAGATSKDLVLAAECKCDHVAHIGQVVSRNRPDSCSCNPHECATTTLEVGIYQGVCVGRANHIHWKAEQLTLRCLVDSGQFDERAARAAVHHPTRRLMCMAKIRGDRVRPEPVTEVIFACSWNWPAKQSKSPEAGAPAPPSLVTAKVIAVEPVPRGVAFGVATLAFSDPQNGDTRTVESVVTVPGVLPDGPVAAVMFPVATAA